MKKLIIILCLVWYAGLCYAGSPISVVPNTYNVRYENRGDPSGWDFTHATLTEDGTWRDLDLSSIVPAGAKAVSLIVEVVDDAVNSEFMMRPNGNSNTINRSQIRTQVVDQYYDADFVIACDTDRIVEYYASNTTWTGISIAVKGWWY